MRRSIKLLALLVTVCFLAACSDQVETEAPAEAAHAGDGGGTQGGKFGDDRVWPGLAQGKCGSHLSVVSVAGESAEYFPPKEFFKGFDSHEIDLGETPRSAADLASMMTQYSADTVTFVSCSGPELALNADQLAERPGWVVLTGKGLIKLVAQQGDDYITATREIREIRFGSSTLAQASSQEATKTAAGQVE